MKRLGFGLLIVPVMVALASCGQKAEQGGASTPSSSAPAATSSISKYDTGPRAGESPVDEALAEKGEQLFKDKGCSACHAFGQKLSGPDLKDVSLRRTARWMENQILHPDVMTKEDPIARQLFAQHALQMPNQGLQPEEARAVIEYLKHQDKEAGETRHQ